MYFISHVQSRHTHDIPLFFVLILLLLGSATTLHAELVDKIVCIVNDDVITLSELNEETAGMINKIRITVPVEEQDGAIEAAKDSALNSIIDRKLINQKAKEARVSVTDIEVDKSITNTRQRAKLTEEQFIVELRKAGLSLENYRANVRSQMLQRKIVNYDIRSKIVITETMMREYYDTEYTFEAQTDEYYLLQIGFKPKEVTSQSEADINKALKEALGRAQRIHNLAANGQDFGSLAQKFSDLPSGKDRGDIGSFTLDDMGDSMRNAVAVLKAGEISAIIKTPAGYQFFKLLSGSQGDQVSKAPYEQVKDSIRSTLFEQRMQAAFKEWVTELKSNAYIQKL